MCPTVSVVIPICSIQGKETEKTHHHLKVDNNKLETAYMKSFLTVVVFFQ